jgi:hypothetical protein
MDYPPPPPSMPASNIEPPPEPPRYQPAPVPAQQPYAAYRLPKDRTTAVLLAVFLGFVTWMYTYEKDAWKFWVAFAVTVGDLILSGLTLGIWLFVAIPAGIGLWIWGIVDAVVKSQQFYDYYPAA